MGCHQVDVAEQIAWRVWLLDPKISAADTNGEYADNKRRRLMHVDLRLLVFPGKATTRL
jgi:hypothetical protein